ncbi:MAG: hypothetical protein GWO38_26485, partial [Phycisphaerae bacterium]|nr:hypothetical protein [Phycisphaerae bacterium]NIP55003.1 hypothetical protein [Phycisphaerae bacterium]NIW47277.1 hypothetical protein [Gammaproteobacteria bacterium]NIX31077.1 hypothetical protein [Phycisphaerae bacterium]
MSYHSAQWLDPTLEAQIWQVIRYRIHPLFIVYPGYLFLIIAMLLVGARRVKTYLVKKQALVVVMVGLLLFLIPNLLNGIYFTEYFVPLFLSLCPIIGLLFVELFRSLNPETTMEIEKT